MVSKPVSGELQVGRQTVTEPRLFAVSVPPVRLIRRASNEAMQSFIGAVLNGGALAKTRACRVVAGFRSQRT